MQKLDEEVLNAISQESFETDYIPALEGAEYYFSLVRHNGRNILCILDGSDKWRPTNYQEMMQLMK